MENGAEMPDYDDKRLTTPPGMGAPFQIAAGAADIRAEPAADSELVTQALYGETLQAFEAREGCVRVQLDRDRYVGWASIADLSAPPASATHRVSALRTYAYSKPDLKSKPQRLISLNGQVCAVTEESGFVRAAQGGWITSKHLAPVDACEDDPATIAERFLGAPYLWGGRTSLGLDCTGLTIAAFGACGVTLPRDSDMQFAWSGETVEDWARPGALRRGDLVFWKGHVGVMLDGETLLHANAHHMAAAREPLAGAITRIAALYGEPIGAKRIDLETERTGTPAWLKA